MEFEEIFLYDVCLQPVRLSADEPGSLLDEEPVRMPCGRLRTPAGTAPNSRSSGAEDQPTRWTRIGQLLRQRQQTIHQWIAAIREYSALPAEDFENLRLLFDQLLSPTELDEHLHGTLPAMAALAVRLPELLPGSLPRLRQRRNRCLHLTQEQAACLLANAFFCTFPAQEPACERLMPNINFNT